VNPVPVPFRLKIPERGTVAVDGIESVSYQLEGLIHLADDIVTVEWTGTEATDRLSWSKIGTDVEYLPAEYVDIPVDWVSDVRVHGGWWRPRLELRTRRADALAGVPSSRGGAVDLCLRRRDRELARVMAAAIVRAGRHPSAMGNEALPDPPDREPDAAN
jgi:hypothetical protein